VSPPTDLQSVSPGLAIWHAFDRSVKADLFSTALSTPDSTYLIDPIAIDADALNQLQTRSRLAAIVVTNQNHWRVAGELANELKLPVFGHASADIEPSVPSFTSVTPGERIGNQLEVIDLDGGGPGEIALFSADEGGTVIIGDALIHFDPYGFTFLPPKYCIDHRKMLRSLQQLSGRRFERLFFAHGYPILSKADSRLQSLLNST
jgi:glyoxylase-like metal-dependent hydrolase (beta-lactamase superfamily II)